MPCLKLTTVFALLPLVFGFPATRQTEACDDVHLFLARGTSEDYPGRQINVVYAVCNGTGDASCGYEDVQYPASFTAPDYCGSEGLGVLHGTSQITAYAEKCPDAQLVLSGYSQGAQVVGNILGGQSGGSTGCTDQNTTGFASRTSSPGSNIAAVVLFGDVTHVANQTYNTANGTAYDGIYPRTGTQLDRLNVYSDVIQSWCLSNDPVCALGDNVDAHTSYFDIFSQAAGDWVLAKLTL